MKPYLHSLISVKKFGGQCQDYQKLHDWFDQTKAHIPDLRHRTILHNSFGIFLLEQQFGVNIRNSDGKLVSVRDIGEQHVLDDLGFIPTLQDCLVEMPLYDWLYGKKSESHQLKKEDATRKAPPRNNAEMVFDGSAKFLREQEEEREREFARNFPLAAEAIKQEEKRRDPNFGDGILSQEEIDALLMGTEEIDRKVENEETLSQDEIDQMLSAVARSEPEQLEFDFSEPQEETVGCENVLEVNPESHFETDMYLDGVRQNQWDDP